MYPLNDKDLDRLSREAAEQYDVEASASGWERLEHRLDQELPVHEKRRRRFLLWLTFAVLLTGGSLVWMLGGAPDKTETIARTSGSPDHRAGAQANADGSNRPDDAQSGTGEPDGEGGAAKGTEPATADPATTAGVEPNETALSPIQPGERATSKQDEANPVSPASGKGSVSDQTRSRQTNENITSYDKRIKPERTENRGRGLLSNQSDRSPVNPAVSDNRKKSGVNTDDRSRVAGRDNPEPTQTDAANNHAVAGVYKPGETSVAGRQNAHAMGYDIAATHPVTTADPALTVTGMDMNSIQNLPPLVQPLLVGGMNDPVFRTAKWEFGITGGPDFSHVKNKYFEHAGFNAGVTIGYRISNRWQVNTGIIYAKKYYKAAGEDFKPRYWNANWKMEQATGHCAMLEIPLNLRYDLLYNQNRRFFVSAGVSTYLMDNEYYAYSYEGTNGNTYSTDWESDTNSDYFLSNINISAGYERRLGGRFSLQAEPYLKLPARKVGWGNIDLGSYGVLFTLKYKPVSGRSRKR